MEKSPCPANTLETATKSTSQCSPLYHSTRIIITSVTLWTSVIYSSAHLLVPIRSSCPIRSTLCILWWQLKITPPSFDCYLHTFGWIRLKQDLFKPKIYLMLKGKLVKFDQGSRTYLKYRIHSNSSALSVSKTLSSCIMMGLTYDLKSVNFWNKNHRFHLFLCA